MLKKDGKARRMLVSVLTIGGLVYVGLLALLFVFQGRLLFMPTHDIGRTPAAMGWTFDEEMLPVDGEATHLWYIKTEGERRGVVLFSHGNAGNIAGRLETADLLRDLGLDVVLYDYGGYGKSTGRPSEARCYDDARAVWKYLTDTRGIAPSEIILSGRSLGAGPTCQLATEVQAAAVIIESAFLSVAKRAQEMYPIFPVALLIRHRFDNGRKIQDIKSPVLLVHSQQDEIIPYDHGRALYERANEPKEWLEIQGGHNDGFWLTGDSYTEGLNAFIEAHL